MSVYIKSIAQVSTQTPLDDGFFRQPQVCAGPYVRCVEADYKAFISPVAARRMGPVLKRAIATSVAALKQAGVEDPDAIVCGTGLGCIENTEKFLSAMIENNETCLQPTFFINSTHNTIASQVATFLKCHGYNSTYAHLGISFESALMDVLMQMELGMISTALVGGHDEMTPTYFKLFDKVKYWDAPMGECAVSVVIGKDRGEGDLCELKDVDLMYSPSNGELSSRLAAFLGRHGLAAGDIDCIVTGRNGDSRYDGSYDSFLADNFAGDILECRYKHVFGESFTAPAYGLLLASEILHTGTVPEAYICGGKAGEELRNILIVNSFQSKDWSFVLLGR